MAAAAAAAAAASPRVVLLDIEGTVCPISFVKDVLFPYALQALPATLNTQWDSPVFAQYRDAFPPEYVASQEALTEHARDLMNRDVKISYLKSLQGYLWETGYHTGQLKAPLFPDVGPKFAEWTAAGVRIIIYSSGSVAAQKLLFGHTDAEPANLMPMIADYFDTVNAGPKTEPLSYEKIAAKHADHAPNEWLFLSDNVKEVEAAKAAGMQSFIVERPGNAELSDDARKLHTVVKSFEVL
ncbi:acireductone synthase-like protein [Cercophora newfieldiana]|uniref:Enolase-phosphatase E1 n=1 Tax=Cercophora newfieldiana TaxID=92897 RepID=A0AA40CR74_9PEZI|nr:acireductone synthase-like protein [Cercophora newfieldiana]